MEFRQLEAFAAVAETKSFTKAAKRLFLSQSTVSSHIKNLEEELKKDLIIRSTKNIELTEDGETFLFYIKRLLSTKEAALSAINSPSNVHINLGASTIPSACLLPKILSGFSSKYPEVRFFIRQSDSDEIIESILDGTVELGIVGKETHSPKCESIPFCSDELVIVTPATEHFKALKRQNNCTALLLKEPIVIREKGSGTQYLADNVLTSMGISQAELNITAQCNDLAAIKQMVVEGMGISVMSRLSIKQLEAQNEVYTFSFNPPLTRSFYLTYLKDRVQRPVLQSFINFILKEG